ncbi:MAG: N-acetyl-gamma-glutamyl-phosphate reductase [Defluviitoga tunisiensis]
MMNVGILGATGYTGLELIRLLSKHPYVNIVYLTSRSFDENTISDVYPSLENFCKIPLEKLNLEKAVGLCDLIFNTLPSEYAFKLAKMITGSQKKIIDLGSSFRFDDYEIYKQWYFPKEEVTLYEKFNRIYGLPEIYRDKIQYAQIVGNPGCYPTSVLLGLMPVMKNKLIKDNTIIIDSKSGVSGSGHEPKYGNLFSECNENLKPYNVAKHRHVPEMEQELSKMQEGSVNIVFTPHLVPMTRGILSTIYCKCDINITIEELYILYKNYYKEEQFIRILKPGLYPSTKDVYGSNFCEIGFEFDKKTNTLIIMSAIDNLVKGASGQAVQNMNILLGIPENTALDIVPVYP